MSNPLQFRLHPVDDAGMLFISPAIADWSAIEASAIRAVFDLESGLDHGVPSIPNHTLYVYFPIFDDDLPDLRRLHGLAALGACLVRAGQPVLSHCGAGFNRSALLAGLILTDLGWKGSDALSRLRERRPGALFNERFAAYLGSR